MWLLNSTQSRHEFWFGHEESLDGSYLNTTNDTVLKFAPYQRKVANSGEHPNIWSGQGIRTFVVDQHVFGIIPTRMSWRASFQALMMIADSWACTVPMRPVWTAFLPQQPPAPSRPWCEASQVQIVCKHPRAIHCCPIHPGSPEELAELPRVWSSVLHHDHLRTLEWDKTKTTPAGMSANALVPSCPRSPRETHCSHPSWGSTCKDVRRQGSGHRLMHHEVGEDWGTSFRIVAEWLGPASRGIAMPWSRAACTRAPSIHDDPFRNALFRRWGVPKDRCGVPSRRGDAVLITLF